MGPRRADRHRQRGGFKSTPRWRERLKPYLHQVSNLITFCRRLPVTLLADDVGLGKTISAGLVMSELAARGRLARTLIVCPKILGRQWKEELETRFDIPAEVATGRALLEADPGESGAVITTYNSARLYLDDLPEDRFDMLILDEAHKLRNLYGVPSPPQVAVKFRKALEARRFRFVLMLTATPIQNRLWDLYSLVDLLTVARGHENPFGTEGMFARQFIDDDKAKARRLKPAAYRDPKFRNSRSKFLYNEAMSEESDHGRPPGVHRPSRYMRQRRPHLFSDSDTTTGRVVTGEALSYHLETLTSQKNEATFEEFARRLAEKFISPNLRPQTGPTGGGDGKTDAETYPVANAIAERWFVPSLAAQERWAFAFSAKRDWRGKVRSDVASIAGTKRGYLHIYFITNQFVPARESAEVQDALAQQHGVPVTILDRTWLLDRVFDHDSMDIAVNVLGVGAGTERETKTLGPKDFERTAELDTLEKAIGDGSKYDGTSVSLAEDCLSAALLARGLERPRHEVEGRFQRAIRIARDRGLPAQKLAATYNWAWTSYFWYDDFVTFNALYDDVERLALSTDSADEIEHLTNLMPLLQTSVAYGCLTAEAAKLDKRIGDLFAALERLRADTSRPNNSLHAHARLLLLQVTARVRVKAENYEGLWDEFRSVIAQADGLGTFPFESIADALTELGSFFAESLSFDLLYESVTDALAARRSEGEAAKKNVQRGFQKLERGLAYEAIRWFGRAVGLLVKAEYTLDLIDALVGSSIAYEQAGLLWASRNYALAAASHQFSAFQRTGSITAINPAVLSRHFWTELRLGRVPNILSAYELGISVTNERAKTDRQHEAASRKRADQAGMLGALLLRTAFHDLPRVGKLPDGLERIGLGELKMALLFLLGHEDTLRQEGWVPPEETPERVQEFFEQWYARGEHIELPTHPTYLYEDAVTFSSRVVGCEVKITCANNLTSIGIAEAMLGSLEALLATSLSRRIVPQLDVLHLRVNPVDDAPLAPELQFVEEGGRTVGAVTHAPRLRYTNRHEALTFPTWLQEAILEVFLRLAVPADVEAWTASVLEEEHGFSRALTFSNIPTMTSVIFGDRNRLTIDEWINEGDTTYQVKRLTPWLPSQTEPASDKSEALKYGEGDPPEGMFDFERMKHSDLRVFSPIDKRKWDEAAWKALYFMTVPDAEDIPPVLALSFMNREAAVGIFEGWRSRFGLEDRENGLRVAIIKGVTISNPQAYAVVVGPTLDKAPSTKGLTFSSVCRYMIMNPSNSRNLDAFLAEFRRHRSYAFIPAHLPRLDAEPEPIFDVAMGKFDLVVREAWQIGENDPDGVVLDLNDPPVIPMDEANPPVLKALKRLEAFRKKAG